MSRISLFALAAFSFAICLLAGCGGSPPAPNPTPTAGHDHPDHGPHEGHLIELGAGKYHGELTHDDATKTVSIYLLGPDAKTAVAIPDDEITLNLVIAGEAKQVKLAAAKQEGDPEGQASKFTLVDEVILEALESPKTKGNLVVTIEGKQFSGPVEHDDHGHEHK